MGYVGKVQDTAGNTHLVGSTLFGTCSQAASTAAKVVTCSDFSELVPGVTIHVLFDNPNSATNPTLNVNSTGAIPIYARGGDLAGNGWMDNSMVAFTLVFQDGDPTDPVWMINESWLDENTDTKVIQAATTTNSNYPILFKNSANQTTETAQVRYGNTTNKVPKVNPSTGNISATTFNGYTLGAACEKGVDTSVPSGSTSTNVPTTAAVAAAIDQATGGAAGALVYKGTAAALTDITGTSYEKGWYWIASAAFSWTGPNSTTVTVEPGDMIIAHQAKTATVGNDLDAIQTNIEALTTTEVSNLWTAAVAVS